MMDGKATGNAPVVVIQKPILSPQQPKEILKIFEIEGAALGYPKEKQSQIIGKYNGCVESIVKIVKEEKIDISNESELFPHLASIFYSNFNASVKEISMIMTAIPDNNFNCYSSAVLFADVCARLGKKVDIVRAPGHVILSGREYCFETTSDPEHCVFSKERLDWRYPLHWSGGLDLMVAVSYTWAGSTHYGRGEYDKAITCFSKAIATDPKYAEAYHNMGGVYYSRKEYDKAIGYYNKAIEKNPAYSGAYYNMGLAYFGKKEYEKAIECYNKAILTDPSLAEVAYPYYSLEAAYRKLGNKAKADECLETAKRLSSTQ